VAHDDSLHWHPQAGLVGKSTSYGKRMPPGHWLRTSASRPTYRSSAQFSIGVTGNKLLAKQHSRSVKHLKESCTARRGLQACPRFDFHKRRYCSHLLSLLGAKKARHPTTTKQPHRLRQHNRRAAARPRRAVLPLQPRPLRLLDLDNLLQRQWHPPQARRHLRRMARHSRQRIHLRPYRNQRLRLRSRQAQCSASG
jgi:hypothetical protein